MNDLTIFLYAMAALFGLRCLLRLLDLGVGRYPVITKHTPRGDVIGLIINVALVAWSIRLLFTTH